MSLYRRGMSRIGRGNLRDKPQGSRGLIAASQGSAALAAQRPSDATERYQEVGAQEDVYAGSILIQFRIIFGTLMISPKGKNGALLV